MDDSPSAHCISMESRGVRMRFKPQTKEPPPTFPCTAICPASSTLPFRANTSHFSRQVFYLPMQSYPPILSKPSEDTSTVNLGQIVFQATQAFPVA